METIHPSRSVHPFRSIIVVNLISFTEQNMIMHDIKNRCGFNETD